MKAIEKISEGLGVVLILLNALGGIVAGIWLAILGEWGAIGKGVLFGVFGGFAISLAMMPGMLFAAPAAAFLTQGNKLGFYCFGLLSATYMFSVLTAWSLLILFFFADRATQGSAVPMLLWAYGVATGPIAYLAQKDLQSGNEYSGIGAFSSQVAFLLAALVILFSSPSRLSLVMTFGSVMALGLILQLSLAFAESRAVARYDRI